MEEFLSVNSLDGKMTSRELPMSRLGRTNSRRQSRIKLSALINPQPSDDELLFLRQLGLRYCYTWLPDELTNYNYLSALVKKVSRAGLTLYNAAISTWKIATDSPGLAWPRSRYRTLRRDAARPQPRRHQDNHLHLGGPIGFGVRHRGKVDLPKPDTSIFPN